MRITTSDGVGLAVEVAGAGPGLLLVHGFGGAKEDFADHVPALARDHTVVIFDHRGHGASDKPADRPPYSMDRLATDILEVADACGLDRFRLLGHSMGGHGRRAAFPMVAPERVEALVMMDTSAGPIPGFDPALMDAAAEVAFDQGKDALKELLDMVVGAGDARVHSARSPSGPATASSRSASGTTCPRSCGARWRWRSRARPTISTRWRRPIRVPMLASSSAHEDKPFVGPSQAMAAAIETAELAIIPDAGHSPQFENPDAWIDALTRFLASVPAAPSPSWRR